MELLYPDWQLTNVYAYCTTRHGGVSAPPYHSLNMATHVGDEQSTVLKNRTLLVKQTKLPQMPLFLDQVHSTQVITLPTSQQKPTADAVYTNQANQICAVMTADCLPVLFTSRYGNEVAAAHAGWRGLSNGILEKTVQYFQCDPNDIMVWLGPAIGPNAFQVGTEVKEIFLAHDANAEQAFRPDEREHGKYFANLYLLATQRLLQCGIISISGGHFCTFSEQQFFSYRRDNVTGRMVSLIYFKPQ